MKDLRRLCIALLISTWTLGVVTATTATAQESEPVTGPSAVPSEEDTARPKYEGPAIAAESTFGAEGATDVPLNNGNEPTVAVNPTNPNNIAAANAARLRVSTDTGATFSAATLAVVNSPQLRCGDDSLAFDSQGRLFWAYLGCLVSSSGNIVGIDIYIAQVNPTTGAILSGYPVNVTASAGVNRPASLGNQHDKDWLTADRFSGSPFQDNLYIVWTQFTSTGTVVLTTFSNNQGLTWSAPLTLSGAGEGFVWPSHNAVAANGDVYVAYHSQPTFAGGAPNGTSGRVFVLRSTDGGVTYPQKNTSYTAGHADITFNVQTAARRLNGSRSWTQGSAQPWVLPDSANPNIVSVVASDDPTNTVHGGANDDMNVYLVRSANQGITWSTPVQVDSGPAGTTQFFPTAAIDDNSQCLVVTWYDTRARATNRNGNFLLDLEVRSEGV